MIIIYILIALVVAVVIAFVAGSLRNRSLKKKLAQGEISEMPTVVQPPQECCGQHEVCEKESLLAAVSKQIEYYNDEELDRFRERTLPRTARRKRTSLEMSSTQCAMTKWPDGCAACNCAAFPCPTH